MLEDPSNKFKKCLLLLALATGLSACSTTPIASGTDTAQQGNLTAGAKFGAAIGQPINEAQHVLIAQGYGYEGVVMCSDVALPVCRQADRYLAFQPVAPGLKGHIYLKIENDRIAQIAWRINHVAYLDG